MQFVLGVIRKYQSFFETKISHRVGAGGGGGFERSLLSQKYGHNTQAQDKSRPLCAFALFPLKSALHCPAEIEFIRRHTPIYGDTLTKSQNWKLLHLRLPKPS